MAEPFFGSGPQIWSAVPMSGFGYFQATGGNRAPMIPGSSVTDTTAPTGQAWPVVSPAPVSGGIPVPAFEFASTVTPQALLSAVATRRGQPMGPANDQETEDFISDALDLLPGANDVEVRCEGGRATLTGSVPHKRLKRDAGEIVWAIPSVHDLQNNITIATRRRSRTPAREGEAAATTAGRKQG